MNDMDYEEMIKFDKCIDFLHTIGIQTTFRTIGDDGFLPGLLIKNGVIIIDRDGLQHPGDILHEAGHIAVVPAGDRHNLTEKCIIQRTDREAEEMMAIAWSYAASIYLEIDPGFVFHEEGYRDGSSYITESCSKKEYIGLAMLQRIGLTFNEKRAQRLKVPAYPHMVKWLRD
ncbi:hypothetical protein [Chitinophaga sp. MM2321]|uniref:hypothetical protein n=1 Tax=Chitinophaga sp. MM2321 TaxID=3137178 RepID=UPI0032D57EC7